MVLVIAAIGRFSSEAAQWPLAHVVMPNLLPMRMGITGSFICLLQKITANGDGNNELDDFSTADRQNNLNRH
jgi:hypothetical protein